MQGIEPFYGWRNLYTAEADSLSPFYNREYSEFYFSDVIYDHYIHPQWDNIESNTLFVKILYTDYIQNFAIIELLGEWNDALNNDIMILKRNIIETLLHEGIDKFILIGENVLNFHFSDDCYYEEWFDEIEEGWISILNFQAHVLTEMNEIGLDQFFISGGELEEVDWRTYSPVQLFHKIESLVQKRLK